MKTTEVNNSIIGKRCECMFTGMLVTGTIVEIEDNQHTANVKVKYDQPHQWGNDIYTEGCRGDVNVMSSAHCTTFQQYHLIPFQ